MLFIITEKARAKEVFVFVYYESIKRELNTKLIYECRCDERLIIKKMKTRLIDERFPSVMDECVFLKR